MEFTLYIPKCADGSLYIGHADDLGKRLSQHDEGKGCVDTATRRPLKLLQTEGFETRYEALSMERKFKGWNRERRRRRTRQAIGRRLANCPRANIGINACREALRLRLLRKLRSA